MVRLAREHPQLLAGAPPKPKLPPRTHKHSLWGCDPVDPHRVGEEDFFVHRHGEIYVDGSAHNASFPDIAAAGAAIVQLGDDAKVIRYGLVPLPLDLKQSAEVAEDVGAIQAARFAESPMLVIDRQSTVGHVKNPDGALSLSLIHI